MKVVLNFYSNLLYTYINNEKEIHLQQDDNIISNHSDTAEKFYLLIKNNIIETGVIIAKNNVINSKKALQLNVFHLVYEIKQQSF